MIRPSDLALLRDLLAVLEAEGVPCFLVGAGARRLAVDERWGIAGARATLDWDFAVRVESWDAWRALRERLTRGADGRFRPTASPHRFEHAEGASLDLVPYGGLETPEGEVRWPDETRMSVIGFAEAAHECDSLELAAGVQVQVASVPSLALLKLHAYLDRRTRGVTKDVQDFDWLLRHYAVPSEHELRVHEELAEVLIAGEVEIEDAGTMLLGRDVRRIHSAATIDPLAVLLADMEDPDSRVVGDTVNAPRRYDNAGNAAARAEVSARFRAFGRGIGRIGS